VGGGRTTGPYRTVSPKGGNGVIQYFCYTSGMEKFSGFVAVRARGTIALPPALRRRLHLDEPGAQIELTERDDGVIELRPVLPVDADQRWFWTDRWQAMEREVDVEIAAGLGKMVHSGEEFLVAIEATAGK